MALKVFSAIVLAAAALAGAALLFWYHPATAMLPTRTITLASSTIAAEVAQTDAAREQGLSGRAALAEGSGMLFIFDSDGLWGIWMKDMRFPIDIVWADAQGAVVTVAAQASPDTYPQVFYPSAPARYVIELPAGFAAARGIAEGSKLVL